MEIEEENKDTNKERILDTPESVPEEKETKRSKYSGYAKQIACSLILSTALFNIAFIIGSTSMLPAMLSKDSSDANYTNQDLKWLASVPILIGIPGNFIGYFFCNLLGPKSLFTWIHPFTLSFYLLMAFLPTLPIMYFSRLGLGIIIGIFDVIIIPLIAEISEPKLRGFTSALTDIIISAAILCVYVSFTLFSAEIATLCNVIPLAIGFLGSFMVPESPYWLLRKGKMEEVSRSFQLSNVSKNVVQNLVFENGKNKELKLQVKLLSKQQNWKPILLVAVIFLFRELGGNTAILFYALFIFQHANLSTDAFTCTVLVGVIRLLGSLGSCTFHDRVGRRPILVATFFIAGLSSLLGGFFLIQQFNSFNWVPLATFFTLIAMNGIGIGPIPWMVVGELMPSSIRLLGQGIVVSVFYISQFISVTTVPSLVHFISIGPTLMLFGSIDVCGSIIVWMFLPETKKKSLIEIEAAFSS